MGLDEYEAGIVVDWRFEMPQADYKGRPRVNCRTFSKWPLSQYVQLQRTYGAHACTHAFFRGKWAVALVVLTLPRAALLSTFAVYSNVSTLLDKVSSCRRGNLAIFTDKHGTG